MLKRRLKPILLELLAPIRERRLALSQRRSDVLDILREGTRRSRNETQATLDEIREALGLFAFEW